MSRPLRIEFPGAIYHVTSRGDRREPIYRDDEDRTTHLEVIAQAMDRFDAQVLAYCQMGNHCHLVLHTRQANLSRLMPSTWPSPQTLRLGEGVNRYVHDEPSAVAHQQCRRAGAAQHRAQAQQDLRAHAFTARRPLCGSWLQRS